MELHGRKTKKKAEAFATEGHGILRKEEHCIQSRMRQRRLGKKAET
jgi:hypothetical protein